MGICLLKIKGIKKMEIIREKLPNGKTKAWVKRTPEEIAELKKKIEETKRKKDI